MNQIRNVATLVPREIFEKKKKSSSSDGKGNELNYLAGECERDFQHYSTK